MMHTVRMADSTFDIASIQEPWSPQHCYELYGLVSHSGSMHGGHYVSYVARNMGGKKKWFYISDSHVSEVREDRVMEAEAYILFYHKI
jgi:ubiquitin C-terminal hydrolase